MTGLPWEPIFDRLTDTDIEQYTGSPFPQSHDWDHLMERCRRCGITGEQRSQQPSNEGCHG